MGKTQGQHVVTSLIRYPEGITDVCVALCLIIFLESLIAVFFALCLIRFPEDLIGACRVGQMNKSEWHSENSNWLNPNPN